MPRTNLFTILLASASLVAASQFSLAAPAGQGKGGGQGKGQERAAKHMHKNMNAKNVLGEKLKRNGKHDGQCDLTEHPNPPTLEIRYLAELQVSIFMTGRRNAFDSKRA